MRKQLQMQLCGIITFESVFCNCAFDTNIYLHNTVGQYAGLDSLSRAVECVPRLQSSSPSQEHL